MAVNQHCQVLLELTTAFRHHHHLLIIGGPQHLLTLIPAWLVIAFHRDSTAVFQALNMEVRIVVVVNLCLIADTFRAIQNSTGRVDARCNAFACTLKLRCGKDLSGIVRWIVNGGHAE